MSITHWVDNPNPQHTSFPAHDSVTALLIWNGHIISASDDHSIHIHSTDGQLVRSLEGHEGGVWALALHGNTLISGATDRTTRVWDLQTGKCRHIFRRHTRTVRCVVIAEPEQNTEGELWPKQPLIMTGSRDNTVCVWKLPGPEDAEHQDENEDEAGADATVNPYLLFRAEGHEAEIRSVSARGRIAASASYDHTVRVWDLVTGECMWVLRGHTDNCLSFSLINPSRNQVYSSSMDHTVRVWNLSSGSCEHVLSYHNTIIVLLSISPSFLVSADANGLVCVWDAQLWHLHQSFTHKYTVTAIQHDDTKVITGSDGLVRVLDITRKGKMRDLLSADRSKVVYQVAFAGSLCAAATKEDTCVINVWDFGEEA